MMGVNLEAKKSAPATDMRMHSSLGTVKRSCSNQMLPKKVNRVDRLARMVFEVTEVRASDALKVHWAMYQSGATCGEEGQI